MKYYSTYQGKDFFIKQNSTLPLLKVPLYQSILLEYDIDEDMLEDIAVTFSMTEVDSGNYIIANKEADLVLIDEDKRPDAEKYNLVYKFTLDDTKKTGRYYGEFKIDFLSDNCEGKITIPNNSPIRIIIGNSITKTTVI